MNRLLFCISLILSIHLFGDRSNAADRARSEAQINHLLEEMSAAHGFEIKGLSRIEGTTRINKTGSVIEQIKRILIDYNYILLRKNNGEIERLIISSRKRAAPALVPKGMVTTRRRGRHHVVEAVIRGPNGIAQTTNLMVDTGASVIVLPLSMSSSLGFAQNQLREVRMRTANRAVKGYTGFLESVDVGGLLAKSVRVAFVEDERLQGARLLGMSFLRRFRVTIDDENNQITLIRNE